LFCCCCLFLLNFSNNFDRLWWSQRFFSFDHSFYTIVHILDEVNFRSAQSALVRNIINVVVSLGVFAVSSSDLNMEPISNGFELRLLLAKQGQVDVD
jgi:hypothetical protein